MGQLQLKFLGDLEVRRAGQRVELPPSRKTRALLAYLALNPRAFRRERLCELLWEIPDDPRGSLRWSLSKLRNLVDDADQTRIVADRARVSFDATHVDIDVANLRKLVDNGLDDVPLETLERAAASFDGHFLEGLELSNFHDFHGWCIAERELTTRAQTQLLSAIVARTQGQPERALPFARSLVALAPYDETARATLIGLLVALGHGEEAEQQYQLGSRMLKEAGALPTGTLSRALQGPPPPKEAPAATPAALPRIAMPASDSLVGRELELTELRQAFSEAASEREARLVVICGEPGIGKSRLLRAAGDMALAAQARILESSAFESEAIRPFALWVDGLRRHAPDAATSIFGTAERENRERLFGGLSDFVAQQAETGLVALLFDDIQWCDESSAAALHYVARTNRQRPLVCILATRESEMRDNAALLQSLQGLRHAGLLREIKLGPLPEPALRKLIERHAPGADSAQLSRECGGNPLIAIELGRAEVSGDSGGSLRDLVRERLGRFDLESREVLQWAAVLAPRIDVETLERVADAPQSRVSAALESAERQAMLLSSDRGLRFSHDLVARCVYAEISPGRRAMMHRRVAALLEERTAVDLEHAADLAHHASQSGDPAMAARAMVSAGRLCLRFYANDEALSLARRGMSLIDKLPVSERIRLQIDLHDILLTAAPLDDWEASVAEYTALAEQALDHGALSHARLGYYMASYVRWMHGHWSGARDQILQSERVARSGSDEDHIVGMAEAAKCLVMLERDLTHADAMLMEAQALAARRQSSHHAIPAAFGMLRFHENKLDEAEGLFQDARTLAKGAGDRFSEYQANEFLVMIAIERGRFADARARCDALLEIGTKLREGSEAPFARALTAVCEYALGRESGLLEPAFEELRLVDAKHRLAYVLTRAALLDIEADRLAPALARAAEALRLAETLDRATDILLARAALAEASRRSNDEQAHAGHTAAIAALEQRQIAEWARVRAAALLRPTQKRKHS